MARRRRPAYFVGWIGSFRIRMRSPSNATSALRIAVVDVLEYLAAGMTAADIVVDFPQLTADHVQAAIVFAAHREHRLASPS